MFLFLSKWSLYKNIFFLESMPDQWTQQKYHLEMSYFAEMSYKTDMIRTVAYSYSVHPPPYVEWSMHDNKKSHPFEHVRYKWPLLSKEMYIIKGASLLDCHWLIRYSSLTYCESQPTSQSVPKMLFYTLTLGKRSKLQHSFPVIWCIFILQLTK